MAPTFDPLVGSAIPGAPRRPTTIRRTGPMAWTSRKSSPHGSKFARQKSKLAGSIRGSYFVIKNEY